MTRSFPGFHVDVSFRPGIRLDSMKADQPQTIASVDIRASSDNADAPTARVLSEIARDLGLT
jgi:hypothetical protein